MAHIQRDKQKLLARVRRISGQVASLERALESETDCEAFLQQIAAVRGAVNGLMVEVLEAHLHEHVMPAAKKDAESELEPVLRIVKRYLR